MKKNILVVDDSALMRMVMCDIIKTDERFNLAGKAQNGKEALDLLMKNKYDAVVLDVNMPVMGGLELLRELQTRKIPVRVMMASTDTRDGAKVTMDALELGAIDFVHKSGNIKNNRTQRRGCLLEIPGMTWSMDVTLPEQMRGFTRLEIILLFMEICRMSPILSGIWNR